MIIWQGIRDCDRKQLFSSRESVPSRKNRMIKPSSIQKKQRISFQYLETTIFAQVDLKKRTPFHSKIDKYPVVRSVALLKKQGNTSLTWEKGKPWLEQTLVYGFYWEVRIPSQESFCNLGGNYSMVNSHSNVISPFLIGNTSSNGGFFPLLC